MSVRRRRVPARRLAWETSYNRHLLSLVLVLLGAFGVWRAIDPPRETLTREREVSAIDLPAAGYAVSFAQAYLGFDGQDPAARQTALADFDGGESGPSVEGYQPPGHGSRTVSAAAIVQSFAVPDGTRYVVGADTRPDGRMYLSVTVGRDRDGALGVVGSPALVGAPLAGQARALSTDAAVQDDGLERVATRALRNYLAGARDDLAADLTPTAVVTTPPQALALHRLVELRWEHGVPGAVLATVTATDDLGQQLQLTYELAVEQRPERWLVSGIQTNPIGH